MSAAGGPQRASVSAIGSLDDPHIFTGAPPASVHIRQVLSLIFFSHTRDKLWESFPSQSLEKANLTSYLFLAILTQFGKKNKLKRKRPSSMPAYF